MRKILYEAIENRLKQLILDNEGYIAFVSEEKLQILKEAGTAKPVILHYDLWNRQVEFAEQEIPFSTPAVFIEFNPIDWKSEGQGVQDGIVMFGLHIITSFQYGPLKALDLSDKLNTCLTGFNGECFGSMERVRSTTCHDHEELLDSVEIFRCHVKDYSGNKTLYRTSVPPRLHPVVKKV